MLPATVVKVVGDLRPGEPLMLVHCAQCARPRPGQPEEEDLITCKYEAGGQGVEVTWRVRATRYHSRLPSLAPPPSLQPQLSSTLSPGNTEAGLVTGHYYGGRTPSNGWSGTWKSMTSMSSAEAGDGVCLGMGTTGVSGEILEILRPVSSSLASAWVTVSTICNVTKMMPPPPHTVIMVCIYYPLSRHTTVAGV